MKFSKFCLLGSNGISHVVAPLIIVAVVAVGGVFAMVASHADSMPEDSGIMMLYSAQGKYKKVGIKSATGAETRCNKKKNANRFINIPLDATGAAKVTCTPGTYHVVYLKKSEKAAKKYAPQATATYTAAAVEKGKCSFVHKKGVVRTAEAVSGNCPQQAADDTADAVTPVISSSPEVLNIASKQRISLTVQIKGPAGDEALSREECVGSISMNERSLKTDLAANGKKIFQEYPLKYKSASKSCVYVLKFKATTFGDNEGGNGFIDIAFKGNSYLKPANTTVATAYGKNVIVAPR